MIYFLQRANGDIKIGTTNNFEKRLVVLESKHGVLTLLGVADGGRAEEQVLHRRFNDYRDDWRSEWFRDSKALRTFIAMTTTMDAPPPWKGFTTIDVYTDTAHVIAVLASSFEKERAGEQVHFADVIDEAVRIAFPETYEMAMKAADAASKRRGRKV